MPVFRLLVLAALSASAAANAGSAASITNFGIIDNGGSWTMVFDVTNQGPLKDAIFFIQISGMPSDWRTDPGVGYSVVTTGTPLPNRNSGTGAKFSWTFAESGTSPLGFRLEPQMVKVHFQVIGDDWQNAGKSYTGGTVPEPSSLISLLGLASTAAGAIFRRSRNRC